MPALFNSFSAVKKLTLVVSFAFAHQQQAICDMEQGLRRRRLNPSGMQMV
jgi:hypothetical protein